MGALLDAFRLPLLVKRLVQPFACAEADVVVVPRADDDGSAAQVLDGAFYQRTLCSADESQ